MPKRINIITLGCSKNLVDSEKIMGNLSSENLITTHESNDPADILIINTCGFIQDAKNESIETILRYVEAKNRGEIDKLIVTGCLSQRYRIELEEEIPEVDAWFGVVDNKELLKYIDQNINGLRENHRILTTPGHYAYLKIAEGCDRTCSFCAIPLIRGKFRSRSIESITGEANMLASKGVKELLLIAQDISYFGMDTNKKSMLPELLDELVKINGIEWIRLHYAYPLNFPDKVLKQMAENEKILRYLDIPLQHINNSILKSMKRGVDNSRTFELIERLREQVPGITLRTTLMVGYPGETEQQFYELLDFVRKIRFDRLGVFSYSEEENTEACKLKDSVPQKIKEQRVELIMEVQQQISLELNRQKIGKEFRVIVDRREGEYIVGRTEFDSPEVDNEVLVNDPEKQINPGMFCNVLINDASEFEIFGNLV